MGSPTRKQLVERWRDSCTPEILVAPAPAFGTCSFPYLELRKMAVPGKAWRYSAVNWGSVHETIADHLTQSGVYKQASLARS